MKKKILLFLLAAVMCISSALVFTGCGDTTGDVLYKIDMETVYALAQEQGFEGTLEDLIEAFKGDSAYEIAVANGYTGTEADWLALYPINWTPLEKNLWNSQ
jgi:hypothetical protein